MGEGRRDTGDDLVVRDFESSDIGACMTVFDSNVPEYFADAERRDFADFLRALPGPYVVIERGGAVVACGGLAVRPEERAADLCWGMVHRGAHGRGIGRRLTQGRIDRARAERGVDVVALNTSQHTVGFYERFGFRTLAVVPDGFAPGLDRYDMRLVLFDGGAADETDDPPDRRVGGREAR